MSSELIFGVADFAGGYAARSVPVRPVVWVSQIAGLVLGPTAVVVIGQVDARFEQDEARFKQAEARFKQAEDRFEHVRSSRNPRGVGDPPRRLTST